jgi:hypothetical protein
MDDFIKKIDSMNRIFIGMKDILIKVDHVNQMLDNLDKMVNSSPQKSPYRGKKRKSK